MFGRNRKLCISSTLVDLELNTPRIDTDYYEENGLWTLTKTSAKTTTVRNNDLDYPKVVFTFYWQRKILYYTFNIILPTLFIVTITLGIFWLPPMCGEKISLGITVLLAFSVFQIIIMDNTPVNSDVTPRISKVVIFVMCMATISLLSSMVTVYMEGRSDAQRPPRWLRTIGFKIFAKIFCLRAEIPDIPDESDVEPIFEPPVKKTIPEDTFKPGPVGELAQIAAHLEFITNHIKDKERNASIGDEWKLLAKLLDRLLFLICLVIVIIYFLYTLVVAVNQVGNNG